MMAEDDDSTGNAPSNKKNDKKKTNNNNNTGGNDTNTEENEGILDKMKRMTNNCCASTGLCCFKMKTQSQISALDYKVTTRQKQFGVDYLELVEQRASPKALKDCLKEAMNDIAELQSNINDHHDNIDTKQTEVNATISQGPGGGEKKKPPKKKKEEEDEVKQQGGSATGEGGNAAAPKKKRKPKPKAEDSDFSIDEE
jgi:hypothetical protein